MNLTMSLTILVRKMIEDDFAAADAADNDGNEIMMMYDDDNDDADDAGEDRDDHDDDDVDDADGKVENEQQQHEQVKSTFVISFQDMSTRSRR
jgi:hypothetical protein